jgi:phage head maturation protease
MKKFYSIRLKHFREYIPPSLAQEMLKDESNLIRWLSDHDALTFKFIKSRNRLDVYADEKHLTMARMIYPDVFNGRGRLGFMELYISKLIRKKLELEKGST